MTSGFLPYGLKCAVCGERAEDDWTIYKGTAMHPKCIPKSDPTDDRRDERRCDERPKGCNPLWYSDTRSSGQREPDGLYPLEFEHSNW